MLLSCNLPTGPTTVAHTKLIQAEWALAQAKLSEAPDISEDAYKVSWNRFTWRAENGPIYACMMKIDGEMYPVNGCYTGNTIYWNVLTPGVIRHEAAHAILDRLGHFCMRYVSFDGNKVSFHKYVGGNGYCALWIKWVWGS